MTKITEKQKRFADEYVKDLNATQAAIRAGYSEKTAQEQSSRLLSNVMVQAEIAAKQKKIGDKNELTAEWIIKQLKKVYKKCMQAIPVLDHEGEPTGEYRFEANAANRSLELLGKHIGMFTDKLHLSGKDGNPIEIDVVDVKERLFTKLAKLARRKNDTGGDS